MSTVLWQTTDMTRVQSMGYVIKTGGGKTVVIDGGNDSETHEILQLLGARPVDAWFLTHEHSDHVNVLCRAVENGFVDIKKVYYNFPPAEYLKKYEPFCEKEVDRFASVEPLIADRAVTLREGMEIKIDDVTFKVLLEPDVSLTKNVVNESSVVLRMDAGGRSVLFLGDLGVMQGRKLVEKHPDEIKCEYVQMAHHGQDAVEKAVYEAISPRACLWPTARWIWDNDNGGGFDTFVLTTIATRGWMDELGVKEHHISMNGLCRIIL